MGSFPTIIAAMQAAYEDANASYLAADITAARSADTTARHRASEAMGDLSLQTDALRLAILHRMPTSAADLIIVASHLNIAQDLCENCADQDADLVAAMSVATENVLTYLASNSVAGEGETAEGRQLEGNVKRCADKVARRMAKEAADA